MLFNPVDRKVYVSRAEFIDRKKGFSLENIDVKDNADFACRMNNNNYISIDKNGQLMIGPYKLLITN